MRSIWIALLVCFAALGLTGCGNSTQQSFPSISNAAQPNPSPSAGLGGPGGPGNNPLVAVVDRSNHRVLLFAGAPATGASASVALGQPTLTSGSPGLSAGALNTPIDCAFDSDGNLWVVDAGNNRVVQFKPPFTTGMAAALVIGQPDFNSGRTNQGGVAGANTLGVPETLTFDSKGNLYIGDTFSHRILRYAPPFTTNMSANLVLGQADFTSSASLPTGPSTMFTPSKVTTDANDNLFVSDSRESRVLRFSQPLATNMNADLVLGRSDFVTTGPPAAVTEANLLAPSGVLVAPDGGVFVSDAGRSRVLYFPAPLSTGESANLVLGQTLFSAGTPNQGGPTGPSTLSQNGRLALDSQGNLLVADGGNNRVVSYSPPLQKGQAATLFLGQPDGTSSASGTTASRLNVPTGLALFGL